MGRKEKGEPVSEIGDLLNPGGNETGAEKGAGDGAGAAAGGAEERRAAEEKENAPRLSLVEVPSPEPKRKRGRPPKSEKVKTEEAGLTLLQVNMQAMLMAGFDLVAARAGEHWKIQPEEAKAIADPAGRILDRLGITEGTNAASDYIMLAVAVAGVVVPRVMLSQELAKRRGAMRGNQERPAEKAAAGGDRAKVAGAGAANVKELLPGLAV